MTDAPGGYLPPSDRGIGDVRAPGTGTAEPATSVPPATYPTGATPDQAGSAKDEARHVADEGRRQAKELARQAGDQLNEQSRVQKDRAASGLRSLSDEVRSMAQNTDRSGPATDLAHQAAEKLSDAASWLESREPGHLVDEVRGLARRRPGAFLAGAAVAGLLAGRLTRGAVQAAKDDGDGEHAAGNGHATAYPHTEARPASGSFAGESYPAEPYPTEPSVPSASGGLR